MPTTRSPLEGAVAELFPTWPRSGVRSGGILLAARWSIVLPTAMRGPQHLARLVQGLSKWAQLPSGVKTNGVNERSPDQLDELIRTLPASR